MSACEMCGAEFAQCGHGRPRRFCSEHCRKRQYDKTCIDCGARVDGTTPSKMTGRCRSCSSRLVQTFWTEERIVAAIKRWADLYGEPPAQPDWHPPTALRLNDPARAERFVAHNNEFPWLDTVARRFGSWNKAIEAAGFEPRAPYATVANAARRRDVRAKAAA